MSVFSLKIDIADNKFFNGETSPLFSQSQAKLARQFHQKIAGYHPTPLCALDDLANLFGVKKILVKDESKRFGLNAFKVLGGSFAMAQYIAQQMGRDVSEMTYDYLTSEAFRREFGQATFFTATDGNHGRGVAWAANKLGQKAVVHMPKGSSKPRYDNIAKEGADVVLMRSDLMDVARAIELSRATIRNIKQDLFWALFYNGIGIPLAAGVFFPLTGWQLSPMFGAAAMSLSSVCVVSNALRLRSFKPKTAR